jgi:hypothetical protein
MTSNGPPRMAAWLESAWLARYLERQLDAEESAWFEAYLFDKPELLHMLEADNALRDALARHDEVESFRTRSSVGSHKRGMAATNLPPYWLSIAASLIVLAGFGAGWLARPWALTPGAEIIPIPTKTIDLDTNRGATEHPKKTGGTVTHGDAPLTPVRIRVPVAPDATNVKAYVGDGPPVSLPDPEDAFVTFVLRGTAEKDIRLSLSYMSNSVERRREFRIDDSTIKEMH